MSYTRYAVNDTTPSLAVVTGGRSGIGRAIANKIATWPFIAHVLIVSRSVSKSTPLDDPKFIPVAADVGTEEGRRTIRDQVEKLDKPLRFLVHSAGTIDPIKSILDVTQDELRKALAVNLEGPVLLTTALYPSMSKNAMPGRVLHVSSGAAHGPPPVGWAAYGISKAGFYQAFKTLDKEFVHLGGKVRVGSFKPGVVDTDMQGTIRSARPDEMPVVGNFHNMKKNAVTEEEDGAGASVARPPPEGALDSPDNVAFFAEWLLLGPDEEEFANRDDPNEYDIRNSELFANWIPQQNLPKD